jgi:hypothetical protein
MTTERTVIQCVCPHGRILFAAVNELSIINSYAKDIAKMLAAGFTVTRVVGPIKFGGDCDDCNAAREKKADHAQAEMFG